MVVFAMGCYVNIPKQESVVQMMQQGSSDTYVFCAPETLK